MLEIDDRWIELEGAVNARDVGGLPLTGGGTVAGGRLLRSDNLQGLTDHDLALLVDGLELRTVVDLRTDNERRLEGPGPLAERTEVEHLELSLYPETGGQTDLDAETIRPWEQFSQHPEDAGELPTVSAYLGYLRHRPDSIVAAVRAIARAEPEGAVLVHCAAGKDRTGVVVALALELAGVPREEIEADYQLTGERIEEIVARLAASPTYADEMEQADPQRHAPKPGAMLRVLELLDERHGGPLAWLRSHGLQDDEIAALRARLRD